MPVCESQRRRSSSANIPPLPRRLGSEVIEPIRLIESGIIDESVESRGETKVSADARGWLNPVEPLGMPADMVGHEGRNEIVTVVVAGLAAQGQRDAGVG